MIEFSHLFPRNPERVTEILQIPLSKQQESFQGKYELVDEMQRRSVRENYNHFGKKFLNLITVHQLKEELKICDEKITGSKDELIDRLDEIWKNEKRLKKKRMDDIELMRKMRPHDTEVFVMKLAIFGSYITCDVPSRFTFEMALQQMLKFINWNDFRHYYSASFKNVIIKSSYGRNFASSEETGKNVYYGNHIMLKDLPLELGDTMCLVFNFLCNWKFKIQFQDIHFMKDLNRVELVKLHGVFPKEHESDPDSLINETIPIPQEK